MKKYDRQTAQQRLEAMKTHLLDLIIDAEPEGSPHREKAEATKREVEGIIEAFKRLN